MDTSPEPSALPQATVLSYITSVGSPTRVRQVAARALLVIAILHVPLVVWLAASIWEDVDRYVYYYGYVMDPTGPGVWGSLTTPWIRSELMELATWVVLVLFSGLCMVVLLMCVGPVRRGRRFYCHLAIVSLLPGLLFLVLSAACLGGWGLLEGLGLWTARADLTMLLLLLPTALFAGLIALIWDVLRYLRWIARNPAMDKPPVAFLPK